jgi:hypothetical protein
MLSLHACEGSLSGASGAVRTQQSRRPSVVSTQELNGTFGLTRERRRGDLSMLGRARGVSAFVQPHVDHQLNNDMSEVAADIRDCVWPIATKASGATCWPRRSNRAESKNEGMSAPAIVKRTIRLTSAGIARLSAGHWDIAT